MRICPLAGVGVYFHLVVHFLWKGNFLQSRICEEDLRKGKAIANHFLMNAIAEVYGYKI